MLSYMSAKEAAEKWNISQRRVSVLAAENRIKGAMMVGNMWIIPSNAEKPIDKRTSKKTDNEKYGKKLFEITIEEIVSETFKVWAADDGEAVNIAITKYNNGEFVLSPGNLVAKQMELRDVEKNTYTEWFEF